MAKSFLFDLQIGPLLVPGAGGKTTSRSSAAVCRKRYFPLFPSWNHSKATPSIQKQKLCTPDHIEARRAELTCF